MHIWIAVYTKSRHEKSVNELLHKKNIQSFLPLIKVKRKWSDRYKWIEKPLFKGYLFVKSDKKNYLKIVQTHGVHHIVKIGGRIIPIAESEIQGIQNLIEGGCKLEPADYFIVGDEVEISGGPLKGLRGCIAHSKGEDTFVLKIDTIQQAIQCQIERRWLKKITRKRIELNI